jgi:hypothetical protein
MRLLNLNAKYGKENIRKVLNTIIIELTSAMYKNGIQNDYLVCPGMQRFLTLENKLK